MAVVGYDDKVIIKNESCDDLNNEELVDFRQSSRLTSRYRKIGTYASLV
jgi:hypothetical protein